MKRVNDAAPLWLKWLTFVVYLGAILSVYVVASLDISGGAL